MVPRISITATKECTMTTPAQPDTGAEAAPDTGTAPATDPADTTPETTATDVTDWQAEAEKYKALARKHEQRAKANKQALDEAKTNGKPAESEPTIEDLQAQLTEAASAREEAETRAVELAYETTVARVATTVGADAEALLDSDGFRKAVAEELDDDFDDDDLKAAVAKVAKEYAKKPRFAAGSTGPARGGADMGGGAPPPARQRPNSLHGAIKGALGS